MIKSIPKHIHQIWWQGEANIPSKFKSWRESWYRFHPDWSFTLWDEPRMNDFVRTYEPELFDSFYSWPLPIHRADTFRYILLKHSGGWYVDMDIECLRPIDNLQNDAEVVLSKSIFFNNAIMGGIKDHPLWNILVAQLPKTIPTNGKYHEIDVGPMYFSRVIEMNAFDKMPNVVSFPSFIFEPLAPFFKDGHIKVSKNTENSYTIHHQTLEWMTKEQKLLSKLSDLFFMPVLRLFIRLTNKKIRFPDN